MRLLAKNKKEVYYSQYQSKTPIKVNNIETGEYTLTYSTPTAIYAYISPAKGSVQLGEFGNLTNYDRIMLVENPSCEIDENSVLFVDVLPSTGKQDYIVTSVSRSLNHVKYGIRKVVTT